MKYYYKDVIVGSDHLGDNSKIYFVVSHNRYPSIFNVVGIETGDYANHKLQDKLADAVRAKFQLEPYAEVILEHSGLWDTAIVDGLMQHPFVEGGKIKIKERR